MEGPRIVHPTFAIFTLGCKANQYDSYSLARELTRQGWLQVDFADRADAYIVNTCTVTRVADHKSRKIIRRATRRNSEAIVAVTGCAAEWATQTIQELTGAEIVVRNRFKEQLPKQLLQVYAQRRWEAQWEGCRDSSSDSSSTLPESFRDTPTPHASAFPDRVRFLLKVQDGCNKFCTFCIIPRVRGRSRSRPVDEVLAEAREVVDHGFREIVLTGIQLGDYGIDLEEGRAAFLRLIDELQAIEGLARLRISSTLPQDITGDLLDLMASSPKICRHLHIPLQAGSDVVLTAMRRGYSADEFLQLIGMVKGKIPGIGLTTDVMVGFPGESEADFTATLEAVEKVGFSGMHIFKYSRRPGTRAERLPGHLPEAVKEERSRRLFELGSRLSEAFARPSLGKATEVLLETFDPSTGVASGYTDTYLRTMVAGENLSPGQLVTAIPTEWGDECLTATVASS